MSLLNRLFASKKSAYPKEKDVLVKASVSISPNSNVAVNIAFGAASSPNVDAAALCLLILYQAINMRWNLASEPEIIQEAYTEMMADILEHWPKSTLIASGDFAVSLPFIQQITETNLTFHMPWAANNGEEFEFVLARRANDVLYLFDYYPGMPGCGPRGLALNFVVPYAYILDMTLTLLDDVTRLRLFNGLSYLWLNKLNFPFDAKHPVDRFALYQFAFDILSA